MYELRSKKNKKMSQNKSEKNELIISYLTLRKAIGFLGIFLPFGLLLGTCLFCKCTEYESSISHYYYTRMGDMLVGVVCALALFLFCYKGYERIDNIASTLAGVFALGIIIFPTSIDYNLVCNRICPEYISSDCIGYVHFTSASLFFIPLALMSLLLFTKTSGNMTEQKKIRNIVYRACGISILFFLAAIAIYVILLQKESPAIEAHHPVFWFETASLIAFGVSWLVKGEFLLKDK